MGVEFVAHDGEEPGLEVRAGAELLRVAPEDDVCLLEDVVGGVGIADQGEDVGEEPPLVLSHEADEVVRIPAAFRHQ